MILTDRKARRAQSKEDYETWEEGDAANTLNAFDGGGDTRATTIVVDEKILITLNDQGGA